MCFCTSFGKICARIHNGGKNPFRMPLVLGRENEKQWLDTSLKHMDIQRLFKPFDTTRMDAYPISKDFLKKQPDDDSGYSVKFFAHDTQLEAISK